MNALIATIYKELLLLSRDRSGLMVLFLMPAVLVLVVSLVQENILKVTGDSGIRVLFVDYDHGEFGRIMKEALSKSESVQLITDEPELSSVTPQMLVSSGKYQFCIVVPAETSSRALRYAEEMITAVLRGADSLYKPKLDAELPELELLFDPMVSGAFRAAVHNAVSGALLKLDMETKLRLLGELYPVAAQQILSEFLGTSAAGLEVFPKLDTNWSHHRLLTLQENSAALTSVSQLPTSVQQNVPAWALFGMFFIVVPMAGTMIREREDGAVIRLLTLPAANLSIIAGKVTAYIVVCLTQFGMILCMGKYLLPLLGTAELSIGAYPELVLLTALCASLAAAGYGVLLGALASTYEQASMFGPVSIVIAAALGGIMVPVFVMPDFMQTISQFSPLAWGLNAFLGLFVRGGNFYDIQLELLFLTLFFVVTLLIAWSCFYRRYRN